MESQALPSVEQRTDDFRPRVAIVIPCIDDSHLPATVASLAEQKDAPSFEVIVVNATGTDLRSRLARWGDRLDLRVLKAEKDASASANRNAGVAACVATSLLFLDADDTVNNVYVREMVNALEADELVCCSVDMLLLNPWITRGTHPQQTGLITEDMSFLPFAGAGTLGIHRSLFEEIGGWDQSLRFHPEAELCWRIQLAGYQPPTFVPGAILHYRLDPTSDGRWRRAIGLGRTEPLLYRRFRHAGMPRESLFESLRAWCAIVWDFAQVARGRRTEGVRWRAAIRLGRLRGSIRYRVLYF